MPIRCRWPPENSCGYLRAIRRVEADFFQQFTDAFGNLACAAASGESPALRQRTRPPSVADSTTQTDLETRSACAGAGGAMHRCRASRGRYPSNRTTPAVGNSSRRMVATNRRLAAARFAHQAERFTGGNGERDAVHRLDRAVTPAKKPSGRVVLDQAIHLQQMHSCRPPQCDPARGPMIGGHRIERRSFAEAARDCYRTAWMESAAGRPLIRPRHRTANRRQPRGVASSRGIDAKRPRV